MKVSPDYPLKSSLRWEDYANNHWQGSRLRMARNVIGLPHWAMEESMDHGAEKTPFRVAAPGSPKSPAVAKYLGGILDWTRSRVRQASARRRATHLLERLDHRLLRDIGLEPVDIDRLAEGSLTLEELNARRRPPEMGSGVTVARSADIVSLPQDVVEFIPDQPVREAA